MSRPTRRPLDVPLWAEQSADVAPQFGVKGAGKEWTYSCVCGFQTVALITKRAAQGVERAHRVGCVHAAIPANG